MEHDIQRAAGKSLAAIQDTFALLRMCGLREPLIFGGQPSDTLLGQHHARNVNMFGAVQSSDKVSLHERADVLAERLHRHGAQGVRINRQPNASQPLQVAFNHNNQQFAVTASNRGMSPKAMLNGINMGLRCFVVDGRGQPHVTPDFLADVKNRSITVLSLPGTLGYHRTLEKAHELQAARYPDFGVCSANRRPLYLPLHWR